MMYHPVNHRNSVFKSKITMGKNDFVDEMVFGRLDCFEAAKTYESIGWHCSDAGPNSKVKVTVSKMPYAFLAFRRSFMIHLG